MSELERNRNNPEMAPIKLNPMLTVMLGAPVNRMTYVGEAEFRRLLNEAIREVVLKAYTEEDLDRFHIRSMLA